MAQAAETAAAGAAEQQAAVTVRAARRGDMPAVHRMIHELAAHEGAPAGPRLGVHDLIADGFESSPAWFLVLVAEVPGTEELAGYALLNRAYSSWTRRALYMEDLFVRPALRRRGVARALLREICRLALAEDVHRIDWHVLVGNASAEAFYAQLGARDLRASEGRAALRLDRRHIERAAAAGTGTGTGTGIGTGTGTGTGTDGTDGTDGADHHST